jgi:V8-like Glu-specific endopeptidase
MVIGLFIRRIRNVLYALLSLSMLLVAMSVVTTATVKADQAGGSVGTVVKTVLPTPNGSPNGNGRALAFDPGSKHLFFTESGDPHIYVTDKNGSSIATLTTIDPGTRAPVVYGALAWNATGKEFLWGGRYDGSGKIDKIDPVTGAVTPVFTFPFQSGESCYSQPAGSVDGLASDPSDNTLWLSDDASRIIYHVRKNGSVLSRLSVPSNTCNSGIAVDGKSLWLGLLGGPDQPPFTLTRVSKNDPSTALQSFNFGSVVGPEGLAFDNSSFTDGCVLWSNQYGSTLTLEAWKLPPMLCQGKNAKSSNPLDAIGLLTAYDPVANQSHACTASLVDSHNERVVVTAGHCVTDGNSTFTNFKFAPAHTGSIDSGLSPYGVWSATSSDVVGDSRFPNDKAYDFAYLVMDSNAAGERIGDIVPSLNIQFNQGRSQPWTAYGYPGTPDLQSCSTNSAGSENADGSSGNDPQYMTMNCDVLTSGASGGPWISGPAMAVGGVNSQLVKPFFGSNYERGTYLGCQAREEFKTAEKAKPGNGPTYLSPNC